MMRVDMKLVAVGIFAAGLVLGTVALVQASSKARISKQLAATAGAPANAAGKASLNLHLQRNKGTQGTFTVTAKNLAKGHTYDLIVGGVKVGTLHANLIGSGRARFSTRASRSTPLLGFDPRGLTVLLRDPAGTGTSATGSSGDDILVGTIPDDTQGSQACCVTESNGESECEDLDPSETCTGTTPTDPTTGLPVTSCVPDPCNPAPQSPPGTANVCCSIDQQDAEASEQECDDGDLNECAANGGALIQVQLPVNPDGSPFDGNPCDLNPCQSGTPSSAPGPTPVPSLCCVPQTTSDGESEPAECEDLSPDACGAVGGTVPTGATSCDPNPC